MVISARGFVLSFEDTEHLGLWHSSRGYTEWCEKQQEQKEKSIDQQTRKQNVLLRKIGQESQAGRTWQEV